MKKLSLLTVVLLTPFLLLAKTTTVYHTSDTHGFFFPKNGLGGFAALANVLKNGPQPYLLLDSGDFSNGTVETRASKGLKAVAIMNKMGYDATTLGNHEFDFKSANFPAIAQALDFPMLAANFFEKDTQKYPPHILPYTFITRNGVKFAIIGLGNRNPTNPADGYYFSKPLPVPDFKKLVVATPVHLILGQEYVACAGSRGRGGGRLNGRRRRGAVGQGVIAQFGIEQHPQGCGRDIALLAVILDIIPVAGAAAGGPGEDIDHRVGPERHHRGAAGGGAQADAVQGDQGVIALSG